MKKVLKIISIIGILLIALMSTSFAVTIDVNEEEMSELLSMNMDLLKNEVINTDLILVQDNITVSNIVNGNVYIVGEIVDISSENIDGDVFIAANDVKISSNVNGNIYVFTNNLNIEGSVKDVYAFAENINLKENTICRDFKTFASIMNVDGIINRDLYVATGEINISKTGKVAGILSTTKEILTNKENVNEIVIIEDIAKEITEGIDESGNQFQKFIETAGKSLNIFLFLAAEMTGLIIILIIVVFSSKKSINNSELKMHGLMDTVYGLLYFGAAIGIIIGLIFTIIGIPISILLLLAIVFIFWKITIPVASIQFAKAILNQENKSKVAVWLIAFIIFTVVQASAFIPTIGGLIKAIVSLYGFGYMFRSMIRKNKAESSKTEIEVV